MKKFRDLQRSSTCWQQSAMDAFASMNKFFQKVHPEFNDIALFVEIFWQYFNDYLRVQLNCKVEQAVAKGISYRKNSDCISGAVAIAIEEHQNSLEDRLEQIDWQPFQPPTSSSLRATLVLLKRLWKFHLFVRRASAGDQLIHNCCRWGGKKGKITE